MPEINQWVSLVAAGPLLAVSVFIAIAMVRAMMTQQEANREDYTEDRKRWLDERARLAIEQVELRRQRDEAMEQLAKEKIRRQRIERKLRLYEEPEHWSGK